MVNTLFPFIVELRAHLFYLASSIKVSNDLFFVGGVLFKVYIVGEAIKVVRRFSLPDVSKRELSKSAGVFRFPRVSCAAASADEADLDPNVAGEAYFSWKICLLLVCKG